MTIADLIAILESMDQSMHICVLSDIDGINLITDVNTRQVVRNDGESFGAWSEYYDAGDEDTETETVAVLE